MPADERGAGVASDSGTWGPVDALTGLAFVALSRLRGARIFHPHGIGYTGVLQVEEAQPDYPGVALLERPGEHHALVRFSRAAGLPEPLPDALGIAVRLLDVHGPNRHQDFLLVTSADRPLAHHLLLPAVRGFFGQSFSSLLLYRFGGKLRLVGAAPAARPAQRETRGALPELARLADRGDLGFDLALAPPTGRWRFVAHLRVDDRLPDDTTERLAFTPWNTGGGIRPAGPLMGIRRVAYRASQRGRGLQPDEIP
jgi:hypothetical protein